MYFGIGQPELLFGHNGRVGVLGDDPLLRGGAPLAGIPEKTAFPDMIDLDAVLFVVVENVEDHHMVPKKRPALTGGLQLVLLVL